LFAWSNGATIEDIQDLIPGEYSVTVTGTGGCSTADTFTVAEVGSSFALSGIIAPNTNCVIPNGSIDLTVLPAGTYTYAWSNGLTTQDQVSLAPGVYLVTVTDPNGCTSTESFSIADQTSLPVLTETITPSSCGGTNGQIDISVSPAGTYLYAWSNGSTNEDLLNVVSGSFTVTVTDINGCSATAVLFVPNTNSNFSFAATISTNSSCTSSNGNIDLTIMPAGAYTFLWSNGAVTEDITALPAGLYSVTVSDASTCSSMDTYVVTDSVVYPLAVETITPVLCGEANGRIDLAVTPSTGNSFLWSEGSTTEDLDNILPGQYAVTITSQNGCTWSDGFNVPGSAQLDIQLETDIIQSGDAFVTIRAIVNVPISALDTIMWFPEALFTCGQDVCLEQTIPRPAAQTEIEVIAIDTNGCLAQARLVLEDESNPKVYIPNVFSPNGDGINDRFTVYGNKDVEIIDELQIFDRWGNQVFVNTQFPPNEENYGWDGAFRSTIMNPAVFAYWAKVRYTDGSEDFFRGDVTLVR
jgi:gliding motility-associated-like protein